MFGPYGIYNHKMKVPGKLHRFTGCFESSLYCKHMLRLLVHIKSSVLILFAVKM